jgi:hypothetical protein
LFYNSPLLEALDQPKQRLHPLGYADDVNLLTYGSTTAETSQRLVTAHNICLDWSKTHGMKFAEAKYTLIHFTRKHQSETSNTPVILPSATIHPSTSARILGVEVDNKLRWTAQIDKTRQKLVTQMYALTRTTASTWGATMIKARQLYIAIIRSAIGYASPIWFSTSHRPVKKNRVVSKLATAQNKALRIVTGAFKATKIRQLEVEAYIPPIDLWLQAKTAYFQRRLERTGMAELILSLSAPIRRQVLGRRWKKTSPQPVKDQTPFETARADTLKWFEKEDFESCDGTLKTRVLRNWKTRWRETETCRRRVSDQVINGYPVIPQDTEPTAKILGLHKNLRKAESSVLVQARTGCIGLNQFLYKQKVPGITSPNCTCSSNAETAQHIVLYCTEYPDKRALNQFNIGQRPTDYRLLISAPGMTKALAKWVIDTGRLAQYSLARSSFSDR